MCCCPAHADDIERTGWRPPVRRHSEELIETVVGTPFHHAVNLPTGRRRRVRFGSGAVGRRTRRGNQRRRGAAGGILRAAEPVETRPIGASRKSIELVTESGAVRSRSASPTRFPRASGAPQRYSPQPGAERARMLGRVSFEQVDDTTRITERSRRAARTTSASPPRPASRPDTRGDVRQHSPMLRVANGGVLPWQSFGNPVP